MAIRRPRKKVTAEARLRRKMKERRIVFYRKERGREETL